MAASLGGLLTAAMGNVHAAVSALLSLLHNTIQQRAAMVTPCRFVVGGALELVRAWLLKKNQDIYDRIFLRVD